LVAFIGELIHVETYLLDGADINLVGPIS